MTVPPLPDARDARAAERNNATARHAEALISWLRKRTAYPHATKQVALIETHISWLFLTDQFVYKLKKPVRFEFLDFSTPELRRAACIEEFHLNKRLAPSIYQDVVPVLQDSARRFHLGNAGNTSDAVNAIDWLVKMQRLPADRALDVLLQQGPIHPSDQHDLAAHLNHFYAALPPLTVKTDDYRRSIQSHVLANKHDLLNQLPDEWSSRVERVHNAQQRFLHLAGELFDARVLNGRIVDGHGDLRPEHIYLCRRPTIIDCIEFSPELRKIDVLDELAFLCMECDRLGNTQIGRFLIDRYREECGDAYPASLLSFYQCYRACVRAKVHTLRSSQTRGKRRQEELAAVKCYLGLADHYAAQLGPPCLLVVRGLSGTGKSTLAKAIADSLAMPLLQTDVLRSECFPEKDANLEYRQGRYAPARRRQVYDAMFQQAADFLQKGCSVVLDGSFLSLQTRQEAALLASRFKVSPLFFQCECPLPVARERIRERQERNKQPSEFSTDWLDLQQQANEPDSKEIHTIRLDTTRPSLELLEAVDTHIRTAGWASATPAAS